MYKFKNFIYKKINENMVYVYEYVYVYICLEY